MSPQQMETQDTFAPISAATASAIATAVSGTATSGSQHLYGLPILNAKKYLEIKASKYDPVETYDKATMGGGIILLDESEANTASGTEEAFQTLNKELQTFDLPGSNMSLAPPMGIHRAIKECSEAFSSLIPTDLDHSAREAFESYVKYQAYFNKKVDLDEYVRQQNSNIYKELEKASNPNEGGTSASSRSFSGADVRDMLRR